MLLVAGSLLVALVAADLLDFTGRKSRTIEESPTLSAPNTTSATGRLRF